MPDKPTKADNAGATNGADEPRLNGGPPDVVRVFIGYDPRQTVAFTVLARSIIARSKMRVQIEPLMLETLPITRTGLTPFTFSRFLVPWLCGYEGWAIFLDADIQVLADIGELWAQRDDNYAVQVVQSDTVIDGRTLDFEWASVMIFNNRRCWGLTPEHIETTTQSLHKMAWCDPSLVGRLPGDWNHLVGYDPFTPNQPPKLLHFTQGVPVWPETNDGSQYAQIYHADMQSAMTAEPWINLMGRSVHAGAVYARLAKQAQQQPDMLVERAPVVAPEAA